MNNGTGYSEKPCMKREQVQPVGTFYVYKSGTRKKPELFIKIFQTPLLFWEERVSYNGLRLCRMEG